MAWDERVLKGLEIDERGDRSGRGAEVVCLRPQGRRRGDQPALRGRGCSVHAVTRGDGVPKGTTSPVQVRTVRAIPLGCAGRASAAEPENPAAVPGARGTRRDLHSQPSSSSESTPSARRRRAALRQRPQRDRGDAQEPRSTPSPADGLGFSPTAAASVEGIDVQVTTWWDRSWRLLRGVGRAR